MKVFIVDHAKGEYEVTNENGVQQVPYRSRKVANLVAGYYKHVGYTVIVKKGKKMPTARAQEKQFLKNAAESLWKIETGIVTLEDLHNRKRDALFKRQLVDPDGNITDAGRELMREYPAHQNGNGNGANPKHNIKRDATINLQTQAKIDEHLSQRSPVSEAESTKVKTYVTRQKLIALRSRLLALIRDDTTGLVSGLIDEVEMLNEMIDMVDHGQS